MRSATRVLTFAMALGSACVCESEQPHSIGNGGSFCDAVKIGSWRCSFYLMNKFYARFSDQSWRVYRRGPSKSERVTWVQEFLIQQTLIAEAARFGFLQRGEVTDMVRRMAFNVLIQPTGPLYCALYAKADVKEKRAQEELREDRRRALLTQARASPEALTVTQMLAFLKAIPANSSMIPMLPRELSYRPLAQFIFAGKYKIISCGDYRIYFNNLFLRVIPRNPQRLYGTIGDMIVADFDYRQAVWMDLDRTPEFLEDRLGFEGYQALELYEREILSLKLKINESDIAAYYACHTSDFRRPTKVLGRLEKLRLPASSPPPSSLGIVQETAAASNNLSIELDRYKFAGELEAVKEFALRVPEGGRFGPMLYHGDVVMFIKVKDLDSETLSLHQVADVIRDRLKSEGLKAVEPQQAMEAARHLKVEDHVDYSIFGLSSVDVKTPWQ